MVINHKYKFLFVHIHKTGGSSIRNSLLELEGSEFYAHHHTHLKWINYNNFNSYYKFCFVRNPWDRLVSWYCGILKLRTNNNFQRYIKSYSSNFSEFLNCTRVIHERIFSKNEKNSDNSIPYYKSISYNQLDYISDVYNNNIANYIGKFENLNNDWAILLDNLKINFITLKKDNVGNHKNYKNYYNEEDILKVKNLYKKDIEFFNYTFNA